MSFPSGMTWSSSKQVSVCLEQQNSSHPIDRLTLFDSFVSLSDRTVYTLAENRPYGIDLVQALDVPDVTDPMNIKKVCIIDSGYDLQHVDLPKGAEVTGDGDLCSSGDCRWDEDDNGHGTHVAGTVAAIGGNGKGVVGVNHHNSISLHIVRVFGASGGASSSSIIAAMNKCRENGANIISMSLGYSTKSFNPPQAFSKAVDTITDNGILVVAAAGNDGNGNYGWPASIEKGMSVASVRSDSKRSSFSQYNDAIDITAPGSFVLSTFPDDEY